MKICRLIISLFVLSCFSFLNAEELFFKWDDNPAFNSEIYNKTIGLRLVNSEYDTFEQSGRVIYLHPSRLYGNTKFLAEMQKADDFDLYTAGISWGKRINPVFHLGAGLELSRNIDDKTNIISLLPGIQIKFTGNLRYSGYLYLQKHDSDQKTYVNSNLSYYLNPDLRTSLSYDVEEKLRVDIDFIKNIGISLFAQSDLKNNLKDNLTAGLTISLNLENSLIKLEGSVLKDPEEKQYRQSAEYIYSFGKYTPPIVFAAPLYPVSGNALNKYGLVIDQQLSETTQKNVVIVVKPGDNLTQISRNLPVNALDHYKDNVAAISEYNNIADPSRIKVGQKIKIPVKVPSASDITVSEKDKANVDELLNTLLTTNLAELKITQAYWNLQLKDINAMKKHTPGNTLNTPSMLNIKAIEAVAENNLDKADRLLTQAIKIDSTSHIYMFNKAVIDFQSGNYQKSYDTFINSIELGAGSEYAFKIYNLVKQKTLLKDFPDTVITDQKSFQDKISLVPVDSLKAEYELQNFEKRTTEEKINFLSDEFEEYLTQKVTYSEVENTSKEGSAAYIEAENMLKIINRKLEHLKISLEEEHKKLVILDDNLNMMKLEMNRRKSW